MNDYLDILDIIDEDSTPQEVDAVMVIAMTSSAQEFYNSLMHELSHLTAYIAK